MALKTTNASTVKAVVDVRARIEREFKEILPLIEIDTGESNAKVTKKLQFIFKLIERFMEDEAENLFRSDKIALEYLQRQVLDFMKKFEEKTSVERLALARSLLRAAKATLG